MNDCSNNNIEVFNGTFTAVVDLPIVTITVITYNSSRFVIETLDSVKKQTYPNLILQISDDYSKDQTVDICRRWIEDNQDRFIKCKIIIPGQNTGVSSNCNRAFDNCETKYHKLIAGDDILLPNCIEDNIKYQKTNSNAVVVFSKARTFSVFCGIKCERGYMHNYDFFNQSSEQQYKSLIEIGNKLPASSVFWNVEEFRRNGIRYDERIPLLEDYPMWISLLRKGVKFHFLDKDTVLYRLNSNSLSIGLFSPRFFSNNILLYLYYFLEEIKNEKDRGKIYGIIAAHEERFYSNCYNAAKKRRIIILVDRILLPISNLKMLVKCILSRKIVKNNKL